ncbi:FUSC family protein [Mobilicoccus sp.]|uniref:FUSC family protein n=1 Tax=Mobilicoccus sp. TaxID=2034349 RepID=UPI0028A65541|nr:FUSC family protein [Mobilicoccus sp.]
MSVPDHLQSSFARRTAAAGRHGRDSLAKRYRRLRERLFFITQIALSAAVAWFIARDVLGHTQPFFAPVAAVVALGFSFGQRLERAVQIVVGVAVGVLIGDIAVAIIGSGYWQLAVIVFSAMAIMTVVDGRVLPTTQAGVQSAMVTILVAAPDQALSRWIDAVVGGGVALIAATVTPATPLRRPREHTAEIVEEASDLFSETTISLRERDLDRAKRALDRARASEESLLTLESLADDGLSVIRSSPFRRHHLPAVQEIADLLVPLDRAMRNLRVLVRRATIALRQGEVVPKGYLDMVDELAQITAGMAEDLRARRLPDGHRSALYELGEMTTYVTSRPTLSSEVIRAQVRSIVLDLLMVSGLSFDEAFQGIPTSYSLEGDGDLLPGFVDDHHADDPDDDEPGEHDGSTPESRAEVRDRDHDDDHARDAHREEGRREEARRRGDAGEGERGEQGGHAARDLVGRASITLGEDASREPAPARDVLAVEEADETGSGRSDGVDEDRETEQDEAAERTEDVRGRGDSPGRLDPAEESGIVDSRSIGAQERRREDDRTSRRSEA